MANEKCDACGKIIEYIDGVAYIVRVNGRDIHYNCTLSIISQHLELELAKRKRENERDQEFIKLILKEAESLPRHDPCTGYTDSLDQPYSCLRRHPEGEWVSRQEVLSMITKHLGVDASPKTQGG